MFTFVININGKEIKKCKREIQKYWRLEKKVLTPQLEYKNQWTSETVMQKNVQKDKEIHG